MLKKITMGAYDNYYKLHKNRVISKENMPIKNFNTSRKEIKKEKRDNGTPLISLIKENYKKEGFYNITDYNRNERITTNRYSPKFNKNDSIEKKRLNSKKLINKSSFKNEEKRNDKSKSKYKEFNIKERTFNKSSFIQTPSKFEKRKNLISPKTELKTSKQNNSPNKFMNSLFNINFGLNDKSKNNISCLSYNKKSQKKQLNLSRTKINKRLFKKNEYINFKTTSISKKNKKSVNKSKDKNVKINNYSGNSYNTVEAKHKLFSINNDYFYNTNYSLYIIDENTILENNKIQKYSTSKEYIKIINQATNNEYKIKENLLKLEPRNWYDELVYISDRINQNGEISKNFNEILEKYFLLYNQFNWIIYSLSGYLENILEEYGKTKTENNFLNYDNGLSNKFETWKNGFKWKNLYIRLIPYRNAKILFNEMKALNYYFFEYLQIIDTNSVVMKNNYEKKIQLSNNIIFPLIGYCKIYNYVLYVSALIKQYNNNSEKNTSDINIRIDELIQQSNKLLNYYNSLSKNSINTSSTYQTNASFTENNILNNKSSNLNKPNNILYQFNMNKYRDLDLENSLGENFYIKDLIQSKLFKEINKYNLIKIKQRKYILFNLAKYIPNLFNVKLKNSQKLNFYSEFNKEKKFFTLYQNTNLNKNIHNASNKYIKTPEDVLDKIYNMKNNFISPLNYKTIFINNIFFKLIYEQTEKSKKNYKSKSFVDHLYNYENSDSLNDEQIDNNNNHKYNNSNVFNKDEKEYIKGKYVILYDFIEPIKLDYSLIKNHKVKNDYFQINELYFLKTNYFSHFYSWCEMLNKNNFNIKSYSDLKYFMKKYSINTNLLFFSLVYIKNEELSDIIKIHLLIKIINQVFVTENANSKSIISETIILYIKNILYPHELSFGNEKTNFNNFYSKILFYIKILFLKYKLIDDYMSLGLLNVNIEKNKNTQNSERKQILEIIPGFDSPKEFLKHIIFIARKKPFCFLSELEIKLNIIINPYIKFKSSLSLESMEGYISKKYISFNKILTYSYLKPIEISGLILAKLINIYENDDKNKQNGLYRIESFDSERNIPETNNNLKVIHNNTNEIIDKKKKKKKKNYRSRRMISNKLNYTESNINSNIFSFENSTDEFENGHFIKDNISKVQLTFVNLSIQKKRLTSPSNGRIQNKSNILFWKDINEQISFSLSPICYKLIYNYEQNNYNNNSSGKNKINLSNYLKHEYKITQSEILKIWNECNLNVFENVHTCTGNAEYALLKTYIYLFIYYYFIKKDIDEAKKIINDMKSIFKTEFFMTSLNYLAILNIFQGLCLEKDYEGYFAKSLMLLLLTYGDPRGRYNDSNGIIQFPLWIISKEILKLKEIIVYEYFKEMYESLEFFELKRNNKINLNNCKKVIDYVFNINNNISNLLSLNSSNNNINLKENSKSNTSFNNISIFNNRRKVEENNISFSNLSVRNIFNHIGDSGFFISSENFNKNFIIREKINTYPYQSINSNFSNILEEFGNKDFAIYIFKYIQSILLNGHQVFEKKFINNIFSNDIINTDTTSQSMEISSSRNSIFIEPKLKEQIQNKSSNNKRKSYYLNNINKNSFITFINEEFMEKLSYKKNIPSGVIISFGNNVHNETSHEKYDIITLPRVAFKLKNHIIEKIYSGWEHNVAITKAGEIFTFGHNQSYQCGLPSQNLFNQSSIPNPTNISKIYNIYAKSISCGNEHTLILTPDKEVFGIGNNEDGVLGQGNLVLKSYKPLLIHFGEKDEYTKKIIEISSGTVHNLALTENGKVFSWGAATGGQLGQDEKFLIKNPKVKKNCFISKPSIILSLFDNNIFINKISCGEAHSVALTNNGNVYSWGFGSNGQLGLGFCEDCFEPGKGLINSRRMIPEKLNINGIKDIQCGKTFTMLINQENHLLACGNNDLCQLGFRHELMDKQKRCHDLIYPTVLDSLSTFEVIKISCGESHCIAIINDSTFSKMKSPWSWGNNKFGQLGQGSIVKIGLPSPINLLLDYCNDKSEFEEISCGGFHSLCLIKRKKSINWIFDDFNKKILKIIDDINI